MVSCLERRSDDLPQSLRIDVEKTLSGDLPESLVIQGAGWVAMNNSDTWHRMGTQGNPEMGVGDSAVIPLYLSSGATTVPPTYVASCTGVFIIEDGLVRQPDHGLDFQQEGVYSMTEQELVAVIEELAG